MRITIVSGGQTGVDRGAMDAAIRLGLDYGGWAPAGFLAEDGNIPAIYATHMRESSSPDYGMRTRLNVQDSDGTLIVSFAEELSGGSAFTGRVAKQQRKPAKHLVLPARGKTHVPEAVRDGILEWIRDRGIQVLNVAGPRESKEPGLHAAVCKTLVWLLEDAAVEQLTDLTTTMKLLEGAIDADAPMATFAFHYETAQQGEPMTTITIPTIGNGEFDGCDCQSHKDQDGNVTHRSTTCGATSSAEPLPALASFLESLESTPPPMERADFDRLVEEFYLLPGNAAGGSLHVVLDDNNWERESVEFCRTYAAERYDVAGERFADLLLTLTDQQLRDWIGASYCGRCWQDIEPDLDGNGCHCPEGPLT